MINQSHSKGILLFLSVLLTGFSMIPVLAAPLKGGSSEGGGDICQDRIESIRNDISDWIRSGGSTGLKLPVGISVAQYNQKVQAVIALMQENDQTSISCVDSPDLVLVENTQKICKSSYADPTHPTTVCYRGQQNELGHYINGFMGLSQDDQYVLVHHEVAVLAGLEDLPENSTDYPISNQIAEYMQDEMIRKLGIKATPLTPLYRYFNERLRDHLISALPNEAGALQLGYVPEANPRTGSYVFFRSLEHGENGLYRCYHSQYLGHFVSNDPNCEGSVPEGFLGYAAAEATPEAPLALFRCWNQSSDHVITTDLNECIKSGYGVEGILGYVR
jgi:hypothetical protein